MKKYYRYKDATDNSWKLNKIYEMDVKSDTALFENGTICHDFKYYAESYFEPATEQEYMEQENQFNSTLIHN